MFSRFPKQNKKKQRKKEISYCAFFFCPLSVDIRKLSRFEQYKQICVFFCFWRSNQIIKDHVCSLICYFVTSFPPPPPHIWHFVYIGIKRKNLVITQNIFLFPYIFLFVGVLSQRRNWVSYQLDSIVLYIIF